MMRSLAVTALAGGAWALTAAFAPSHRATDTCSYLSEAQVTSALGVPVGAGQPLTAKVCTWRESGKQTGKKVALTILAIDAFNLGKTPVPGAEKPPASGVGDDAYYKYYSEPRYERIKMVDLDVKKGSAAFDVEVGGYSIEDAKARAKTLALAVAAKM